MATLNERMKIARLELKETQKHIAKLAGINLRTYINYEQGERETPVSVVVVYSSLGINPNWLLTGEGEMFTNTRTVQEGDHIDAFDGELPRLGCGLYGQGDFVFVPISSERACCGKGSPIFEEYDIGESIAVKRSALGSLSESAPPYAVETQGRSMEGFGIREGSTVIVNPAERPTSGDVVLVAINEKGAIKKYRSEEHTSELQSR